MLLAVEIKIKFLNIYLKKIDDFPHSPKGEGIDLELSFGSHCLHLKIPKIDSITRAQDQVLTN